MRYIESPNTFTGKERAVFMAGGISGCPNWQDDMRKHLHGVNITLYNPRMKDFTIENKSVAEYQIAWEHTQLQKSDAILFWFPKETLCPITLYELGAWSMRDKPIFVGVHPDYKRKQDVEIQTKLARPDVKIVYSVSWLADQVRYHFTGK